MNVPFVDLKSQYDSIAAEIGQVILQVINSSEFIGGKYLNAFENDFAQYIGVKHCIGVGNGTDAIFIALKTLGIGPGDEVITAANSFIATSEGITMAGGKVVFVDCDEETYTIDSKKIETAITKNTRAIMPVHLYGQPADLDPIIKIARKHGLFIIEDAAQAHGATYKGREIGTLGHFACFSFYPGKNLGAYGDAGALTTSDDELAKKARMFANHGRIDKYNHEFEGVNSRLDGLQAAVLSVKLKYLEKWTERRRAIANKYNQALKDVVITPKIIQDLRHVFHLYVVRDKNRDRVRKILAEKGIATGIHYPIPLPFLKAYAYLKYQPEDFPIAYKLKDEILSLPMYGQMSDEQVEYVVEQLKDTLGKLGEK